MLTSPPGPPPPPSPAPPPPPGLPRPPPRTPGRLGHGHSLPGPWPRRPRPLPGGAGRPEAGPLAPFELGLLAVEEGDDAGAGVLGGHAVSDAVALQLQVLGDRVVET